MALPRSFASYNNFELAFARLVRGGNKEYKNFYRHLFPSYHLALGENLRDLLGDIKSGAYEPNRVSHVFQPKQTGILRPLSLLTLTDLLVYQAIVNTVGAAFEEEQKKYAFRKSFGAILAGKSSEFFYRSWKTSYLAYNSRIRKGFKDGNRWIADFDLVSFYELIDHGLLRSCLARKVRSSDLLNLLFHCLRTWTTDAGGSHLAHGVPQGPEPSAFLAECLLFHFDAKELAPVVYVRYVDDVKLMGQDESAVRRALLRLDLSAKELGLVPQAQKIEVRKVRKLKEVLKTVPSGLASTAIGSRRQEVTKQKDLLTLFRTSLIKRGRFLVVDDITKFRFALSRLSARRDVLYRVGQLLGRRPDCSWHLANYVKKFPRDERAATVLLQALRADPVYDAAASNYIDALSECAVDRQLKECRNTIRGLKKRSMEQSLLLQVSSADFVGRRSTPDEAVKIIRAHRDPRVRGILLSRLFGSDPPAPFVPSQALNLLRDETRGEDPDLARYCAHLLLTSWPWPRTAALPHSRNLNHAVKLLLLAMGLRQRTPSKRRILEVFFQDKIQIHVRIPWRKALRSEFKQVESRCIRLQQLWVGEPGAKVQMLDTFNELLVQNFSRGNPGLSSAYTAAAGGKPHPDWGAWIRDGNLIRALPKGSSWFVEVHDTRVASDLSHAKQRAGKSRGRPTRRIEHKEVDRLIKGAQKAWAELISQWVKFLS